MCQENSFIHDLCALTFLLEYHSTWFNIWIFNSLQTKEFYLIRFHFLFEHWRIYMWETPFLLFNRIHVTSSSNKYFSIFLSFFFCYPINFFIDSLYFLATLSCLVRFLAFCQVICYVNPFEITTFNHS